MVVVGNRAADRIEDEWFGADEPRAGVDPSTGEIVYDSPLETLAARLEAATDEYATALDTEAEMQNAYERAYALELIKADDVPVTIRDKFVKAKVVEQRCAMNLAEHRAAIHKAKVAELSSRLVAAQSHMKFVGMQT